MPRLRRKNRSAFSGFNNEEDRDPSECSTTGTPVQKKEIFGPIRGGEWRTRGCGARQSVGINTKSGRLLQPGSLLLVQHQPVENREHLFAVVRRRVAGSRGRLASKSGAFIHLSTMDRGTSISCRRLFDIVSAQKEAVKESRFPLRSQGSNSSLAVINVSAKMSVYRCPFVRKSGNSVVNMPNCR